jgi:hypothetical protein
MWTLQKSCKQWRPTGFPQFEAIFLFCFNRIKPIFQYEKDDNPAWVHRHPWFDHVHGKVGSSQDSHSQSHPVDIFLILKHILSNGQASLKASCSISILAFSLNINRQTGFGMWVLCEQAFPCFIHFWILIPEDKAWNILMFKRHLWEVNWNPQYNPAMSHVNLLNRRNDIIHSVNPFKKIFR